LLHTEILWQEKYYCMNLYIHPSINRTSFLQRPAAAI